MVVKMMSWSPWPPLSSKKFETTIGVHRLHGLPNLGESEVMNKFVVEIKWKGQKGIALKRSVKRNFTEGGVFGGDGVVEWNEKFQSVCSLVRQKEGLFYPWEIVFTVFKVSNPGLKNKVPVGTASLNLAEFISAAQDEVLDIKLPVTVPNTPAKSGPSLSLSLNFTELRTPNDPVELSGRSPLKVSLSSSSLSSLSAKRDDTSTLRAGLRKVKTFKDYMSVGRTKKSSSEEDSSEGSRSSIKSEDMEYDYPLETDSLDDDTEEELKANGEDLGVRNSFHYETLAYAKCAGACSPGVMNDGVDDAWIYYRDSKLGDGWSSVDSTTASIPEKSLQKSPTRKLLSWRKRKLSFKSQKAKGEPLLKKQYGEEGGDDIDFDRRQLSSSDESGFGWQKTSSDSEFGDDVFAVGSWEFKDVTSRDGKMKLQTQAFFASIDQRSERAAGESACTALVAVIADWLQSNKDIMPTRSEFDNLIRQGSLEWRNLCENEVYKARFPDKHFDLETVLQAEICSLSAVSENSFVGFFHSEGLDGREFDFLQDVMSFDGIWDEITSHKSVPSVYIISWNDHFFVLKVEEDAYYIIDTLGERLHEGCNQAYILKFDKDTVIYQLQNDNPTSDEKSLCDSVSKSSSKSKETSGNGSSPGSPNREQKFVEKVVYRGKESCKEYIKSFMAAIPIRELQTDVKKGLMTSTPIHHRLQIEFHYTQLLQSVSGYSVKALGDDAPVEVEVAAV